MSHQPRVPAFCPPGFQGRYTVLPGDSMFEIAQFFRVRLADLITANPHITDPNLIFPGDVLCVPGLVAFPCCVPLRVNPIAGVLPGTGGAAFVNVFPTGGEAVSVVAVLPPPSAFGNFDTYTATVFIPGINGFGDELFPTPEDPPTWATTISLPTAARLTPNSRVVVEPFNTEKGQTGPVILSNTLRRCRCGLLSILGQ